MDLDQKRKKTTKKKKHLEISLYSYCNYFIFGEICYDESITLKILFSAVYIDPSG